VLTLAASARADVVSIDSDMYVINESGPVLGHAIVSVYSQAAAFCTKLGKKVATAIGDGSGHWSIDVERAAISRRAQ
jgi:hypothetical protein